jgi:hypothetical protein
MNEQPSPAPSAGPSAAPLAFVPESPSALRRSKRRRYLARVSVTAVALAGLGGALLAQSGTPASALCKLGCTGPGADPTTTTAPPNVTTISKIAPTFAWSGDPITLVGTGFTGATVTVQNQAATITSGTATTLHVVVPTLTNTVAGPNTIPVVVSSPTGTASTSFQLSPSLQTSASQSYGTNAKFGQGNDGWSSATSTIDRSSGFTNTNVTVHDQQFLFSLSIDESTVWLDGNGTVVGFTPVHTVSADGSVFHWPSGDSTTTQTFSDVVGPNPGVGSQVRAAQIVFTRNHATELTSTLQGAVALGQSIYSVASTIVAFG